MQSFAASFGIAFGCPQVPILDNLAVTSADSATSLNHPLIPRHCRCSPYVCLQVFPRDLLLDFKVHLCTPTLPVRRSLCSISPSGPVSPSAWGRLDGFGNPHRHMTVTLNQGVYETRNLQEVLVCYNLAPSTLISSYHDSGMWGQISDLLHQPARSHCLR